MASVTKRRRSGEARVTIHTLTVPWVPSGSYGLKFVGSSPVAVSYVAPRSSAEAVGVQVGDLVTRVNSRNVTYGTQDSVHAMLKHSQGSAINLQIGRVFPAPVTEAERQAAFVALKSKLETMDDASTKVVEAYKATIDTAFQDVQDILGSLSTDQVVPDTGGVQEITIPCYDSESLPSPPSSEEEEGEVDPLLDFSLEDDLNYTPVKPMLQAQIEAERGLRGMREIIEGVREKAQEREEEKVKKRALFSTETSMPVDSRRKKRDNVTPLATQPPQREVAPVQRTDRLTGPPRPEPAKVPPPQVEQQPRETPRPRDPVEKPAHRGGEVLPTSKSPPKVESGRGPEEPTPPTVPPYKGNDTFLLSNKPEYIEEWRKDTHTYEEVDVDKMVRNRSQSPASKLESRTKKALSPLEPARVSGPVHTRKTPSPQREVTLVRVRSPERLPATNTVGYVADPSGRQKSFEPHPPQKGGTVTDMKELDVACRGLPPRVKDWKSEEVGLWLKQLSPTLYENYFTCFSKHDITGRSLMRLSDGSLKSAGIDDPKHRRLLSTMIIRLRIQQEAKELQELESKIERTVI